MTKIEISERTVKQKVDCKLFQQLRNVLFSGRVMNHSLHLDRTNGTAAFVQLFTSLLFVLCRRPFACFHGISTTLHISAITKGIFRIVNNRIDLIKNQTFSLKFPFQLRRAPPQLCL